MMMKMKKQIMVFLMALLMIAGLAGCGGSKSKSAAGTYKMTKMGSGDMEMSAEEMSELFEMEVEMVLELKDDNSFTLDLGFLGDGETANGTWKMDGDSLILSAEGDEISVTYDGKTIVMDVEGESITFEKQ